MEELKLLVDLIKDLPAMAIYVLVGFFVYKTIVVGSIYGVVRLGITKLHDAIVSKKAQKEEEVQHIDKIDRITIAGEVDDLIDQLSRLKGVSCGGDLSFIHDSDIKWLKRAIDEKLYKEMNKIKVGE